MQSELLVRSRAEASRATAQDTHLDVSGQASTSGLPSMAY